ncbi:DgyrCDS7617 [Dimorphilus gyrociliatus]|uniref:Nuclear pore complex protein n=1 Tax=Dimorphilus gyrociliatus TaxID=2664684 RepID=A0A7I8VU45_9ANNE|nr:DgyrCDS7617 [Dimorphilus gyrociliatus]
MANMSDISFVGFHASVNRSEMSLKTEKSILNTTNPSHILEEDPSISQATSLFSEFMDAMRDYGNEHEILPLLLSYEQLCSDHVKLLSKLLAASAPNNRLIQEAGLQRNLLEQEKQTWMLLYTLYDDRVRTDGRKAAGNRSEIECKTEKQLIKRLFEMDDFVRTAQRIVDWLEYASAEKLEEFYNKIQYFIDHAGQAGENTLFSLKRGKYSGIVQHMDPDACMRENQKLTSLDEEDEDRLLRHIWACIRAGQLEEAQHISTKCGQPWRAATLEGWRLYHDPNLTMEDEGEVEGNTSRDLWTSIAWKVCESEGVSSLEKAIYGTLCGHLPSVLAVCQSWHDHFWARLKVAILARVEQELFTIRVRSAKMLAPPEDLMKNSATSFSQILNDVEGTEKDRVKYESKEKYNILQKLIILGDTSELLRVMAEWIDDELEEDTSLINSHLLRFMAHLVLFLRTVTTLNDAAADDDAVRVLRAYVQHLIKSGPSEVVSFYTAKLPIDMQADVLALFFQSVTGSDDRHAQMFMAQSVGIDVYSATRGVVQLIRDDPKSTDEEIISALEWLTFDRGQRMDAIKSSNSIIRMFLMREKLDVARQVLSKLPDQSIDQVLSQWTSQMGFSDLPPEDSNAVRELLALKAYLEANTAFQDWFTHIHRERPNPPNRLTRNAAFQDRVAFEQENKAFECEMDRWQRGADRLAHDAVDKLYKVLNFPGKWLIDEYSSTIGDELRQQQLRRLRQFCIPSLVNLLLTVLRESNRLREAMQVADILADEEKQLYSVFSQADLQRLMNSFREFGMEFMQNPGIDSLGYKK